MKKTILGVTNIPPQTESPTASYKATNWKEIPSPSAPPLTESFPKIDKKTTPRKQYE